MKTMGFTDEQHIRIGRSMRRRYARHALEEAGVDGSVLVPQKEPYARSGVFNSAVKAFRRQGKAERGIEAPRISILTAGLARQLGSQGTKEGFVAWLQLAITWDFIRPEEMSWRKLK